MRLVGPLLVVAAGLAVYGDSFDGPLIYDDLSSIPQNPTIRQLRSLDVLRPPDGLTVSGRPLVNATLALDYAIGGLNVAQYHATNLGLHLLCGLLLLAVVRRTLQTPLLAGRWAAVSQPAALVVALLWVVHPLQTEAVAYVIQRTELLVSMFYLLVLYAFIRSVCPMGLHDRPETKRTGAARLWQVAAVLACACGMASKEVMVSAPLAVLAYDRLFCAGSWRGALQRRWGLYLGLAATGAILAALVASGPRSETAGFGLGVSPWVYAQTQCQVLAHYLALAFWPAGLSVDYGGWPLVQRWVDVLPHLLVIVTVVGVVAWGLVRGRAWSFLGVVPLMILGPSSSIVPIVTEIAAERRMYLPLAGLVTAGVLAVCWIWLLRRPARAPRLVGAVTAVAVIALVTASTVASRRRVAIYRDEVVIWRDTLAKRPANPRAHNFLGKALAERGRFDLAAAHFDRAIALDPDTAEPYLNRGRLAVRAGDLPRAERDYDTALRLDPTNAALRRDLAKAHANLGDLLLRGGRPQAGLRHLSTARRLAPRDAHIHYNMGSALQRLGRLNGAIAAYRQSVALDPNFAAAHNNLGVALMAAGRPAEADRHFRRALTLDPGQTQARQNMGRPRRP